ncbi:MAG: DUF1501 domain-containing protein [Planctomycetia bacterium]|nr:DUF1501 domain-containing protein [Planctomycetia bacterium]
MASKYRDRCALSRRSFLADAGMGLTGLALGSLLQRDGIARAAEVDRGPHFPAKAKTVIWIFLCGGVSHLESFDPKPVLEKYSGKKVSQTPHADALAPEKNPFALKLERGAEQLPLLGMQTGFQRYGKCGMEVSDFFPHIGGCADDIAVVRSFWTSSVFHSAQLQFHTGRQPREVGLPTIGSWVCYGLGTLNQNLPDYVVLGTPTGSCCGSEGGFGAGYLGPRYGGVRLNVESKNPLPFVAPADPNLLPEERTAQLGALGKLNELAGVEYPDDPALRARIQSYELAARMQTSVPETLELAKEKDEIKRLYGIDQSETKSFGTLCLAARRLAERGVRFVQVFHGTGDFGPWDSHEKLKEGHGRSARAVDKPIAGLLQDLKQRGLLKDTLVVCGTEFGRTPTTGGAGREHSPFGFSSWLAGGGVQGGIVHGQTDELGYHAVEDRHYITDIHATVLHQLGVDSRRLEIPGRKRLDIDHGKPIKAIL